MLFKLFNSSMQNSVDFIVADDHDTHNTSAIYRAHNKSDLLQHLCTCQEQDYNWCFIHSKDKTNPFNDFGFMPVNSLPVPLSDLQQWAFQAHL